MTKKKRNKFGPWSDKEKTYIAQNAEKLTVKEIAEEINRDPVTVSKYIRKTLGMRIRTGKKHANIFVSDSDIAKSFIWHSLQQEFTEEELRTFLYHWGRIITQFKDDVFPTEEMQIIDTIKLEILQARCLKSQHEVLAQIQEYQRNVTELRNEDADLNAIKIDNLTRLMIPLRQALDSYYKEFNDLLQRKSSMLKELKATRDQRLKRIEDSKQTFTGWMSEILTNSNLRRELGLYIEKHRLATDVEAMRLSEPYKFADNEYDLPLLTAETLEQLNKEINKGKEEINE